LSRPEVVSVEKPARKVEKMIVIDADLSLEDIREVSNLAYSTG